MQRRSLFSAFLTVLLPITAMLGAWGQPIDTATHKPPIVFVHGLFQNGKSWEQWQQYFKERGYTVYAPSYPYHEGEPAVLRKHPPEELPQLDFMMAYRRMADYVDALPEKPIVVGHSMGGLIMQKLMEEGKIRKGVALAPANPRGVSVWNWQYMTANFRMVNPLKRRDVPCTPPMSWFYKTFFNTLHQEEARQQFERYFVPESRIIAKSSTARGTEIDFAKPHRPMLFIAGEKDQDLPPALIYRNFLAYQDPNSQRNYYEFPKRSHYICQEEKWEEVAAYVLDWIVH